jgi:phosphoenolpyruvate carboxylase
MLYHGSGLGSYASWDEGSKINFLQSELSGKRPLIDRLELSTLGFDAQVRVRLSLRMTALL